MHTGCETDSTSTFTCSVDDSVVHSFNVLKELGLRSAWVTEKQHVDVTANGLRQLADHATRSFCAETPINA